MNIGALRNLLGKKITETRQRAFENHFTGGNRKLPSSIYHYTPLASAVDILRTGKFRLTDMRFLNDPSEIRTTVNIFNKVSKKYFTEYIEKESPLYAWHIYAVRSAILYSYALPADRPRLIKELKHEGGKLSF